MGILDLFSKRNKPAPDVFVYDKLPQTMRVQAVHIIEDVFPSWTWKGWAEVAKAIAKEHGLLALPTRQSRLNSRFDHHDYKNDCDNYILSTTPDELAVDMIELLFRVLDRNLRDRSGQIDDAIKELNDRFRANGVGLAYQNGIIVRVDSQYLHAEPVKATLRLLNEVGFEGPEDEFLSAHEHHRHGRVEEAITDACKAFESTMKAIADKKKWKYDKSKATAGVLIKLMIEKKLLPEASKEQLDHLDKVLVGLATVRNKNAGHGTGTASRDVPAHYAAYGLHMAASNIVFLVECFKVS